MRQLPTLFKKTQTGAIQQWTIRVVPGANDPGSYLIVTEYGQVGGKLQKTAERVEEGVNVGKKNETTAREQALSQAESEWRRKIERNGYVRDLVRAEAGETDAAGGIAPMLAQPFDAVAGKVKYPLLMQRKYNGFRCIAVYENGEVTLWSRKREAVVVPVPHIIEALERHFEGRRQKVILDGELYLHGWSLQTIASYVRQKKEPKPGHARIEYHVYDLPSLEMHNRDRQDELEAMLDDAPVCIKPVGGFTARTEAEAWKMHDEWVKEGYEGAIGRNPYAFYQPGKRSADLIKFKRFDESEFEIVDSRFGRGRYEDIPILRCVTKDGNEFDCNLPGTLEERASVDRKKVIGKMLTVKHFGWTDDGLPSFPVGVVIRDYE